MHSSSEKHLKTTKRVVKYIKGIISYGVKFQKSQNLKLVGYSDSDWGDFLMICRVLQDTILFLAKEFFHNALKNKKLLHNLHLKQFITATATVKQILWLKKKLTNLNMEQN